MAMDPEGQNLGPEDIVRRRIVGLFEGEKNRRRAVDLTLEWVVSSTGEGQATALNTLGKLFDVYIEYTSDKPDVFPRDENQE